MVASGGHWHVENKFAAPGQGGAHRSGLPHERQRVFVTIEDTVYEGSLVLTGPGEGWLNYAGRILPFYMSVKQNVLTLWVEGKTYSLNLVTLGARRAGGTGSVLPDGEIKAPMPGTVLKVLVKPGDTVEANQPLVIMESMKMEMTLSAPQASTVTDAPCAEGQLVEMGALLVRLDPL
jgi:acetyl/propionyl-CoA carboxylase alpha subunit